MSILFINGSPNKNGNTAVLAEVLLSGKEHETLNLTDYRIGSYGQKFPDDQLNIVIEKIKQSEVVVIGSPLYWHNICGSVRNMLDRWSGSRRFTFWEDAVFSLSRCRTGKVDDGSRGIYHEAFCGTLRNEVCGNGSEPLRGGQIVRKTWIIP